MLAVFSLFRVVNCAFKSNRYVTMRTVHTTRVRFLVEPMEEGNMLTGKGADWINWSSSSWLGSLMSLVDNYQQETSMTADLVARSIYVYLLLNLVRFLMHFIVREWPSFCWRTVIHQSINPPKFYLYVCLLYGSLARTLF